MPELIYDLDTQVGIIQEDETLLSNIRTIIRDAMCVGIPVAGETYYNDGMDTKNKHPQTIVANPASFYNCPITRHGIDLEVANSCHQVYFEKNTLTIWNNIGGQPDNLMTYLRSNYIKTVYIVGTDSVHGSLISTVGGFLENGYNVVVVTDAFGLYSKSTESYLTTIGLDSSYSVRFATTAEVVEELK